MNRRAQTILIFLDLLEEGKLYTHLHLLRILQGAFCFREKTSIAYIEDMKRMGLFKVAGDRLLKKDEREIHKFKQRVI